MADSNTFSLRIVSLDYYMASPIQGLDISYSTLHGGRVNEVPVIRIFGSTPAGQKTCLHVHGVYPYLFLPCADIPIQQKQEGDAYTDKLSLALEKALKLKSKASSEQQYVHSCSLVKGKRFYGYHSSEELFVKICLYHQQDVSRAANILLGGEVLDKCLQPHEAHIPYILQFLVDYNLYGMGHIHLSKLKFRHPIPDNFSPSKSVHIEQATPNIVADVSESPTFASPIWISSTIPDEWTWPTLGEFDESSFNPVINATKRQSLCQLEGDACVDDILNQRRKSYTPLSQTRSDVKMVQSLVPIWEEEYERTGMHDIDILADTNKPLPEDVLKTLSLGPNFLINHVFYNEEDIYSTPSDKEINPVQLLTPLMKDESLIALDYTPNSVSGEASECLKERAVSLISKEGTSVKAVDKEAMGLLKWLASSQAMDDLNSDDELLRESILGSFLPENTIDEMLEKANMEYESESQKECQEILDSIVDMNEKADFPENDFKTSLEKTIPQVDGAGDDICSTPKNVAKTDSETQNECKIGKNFQQPLSMEAALVEEKSSATRKRKKKKILWGSLPFSESNKSKIEHESINFCYKSTGKEEDSVTKIEKDSTPLVGCSVRDLMRRKRHYRVEPVQSNSHEAEKILLEIKQEESTNTCPSESMLHDVYDVADTDEDSPLDENSRFNQFDNVIVSSPLVAQGNNTAPIKDELSGRINGKDQLSEEYSHEVSYEKQDGINKDTIINSTCINIEQSQNREVLKFDPQHEDLLSLTFCRKPPAPNLMDKSSSKASSSHLDPRDGITGKAMEDCLPFFKEDCQIETEVKSKSIELSNSSPQQENALGVPVHYQNDGTFFYLLSPVQSPPSAEKVKRWLSSGTTVGEASSSKSYAQLGGSSNPIHSLSSLPDDNGKDSPGFGDDCDKNIKAQGLQENCDNVNSSKEKVICNDGAAVIQKDGSLGNKVCSNDYSQDNSQISGPDGKSKATPLSQIGFRDPASAGGGQQLTLLSIEVIAASRGDLQPDPRFDAINIVTLAVQNDGCSDVEVYVLLHCKTEDGPRNLDGTTDCILLMFHEEKPLLNHFVKFVRSLDPDILMGWDVQGGSLGFLAERAAHLGIGILSSISRTPSETKMASGDTQYPGKELDSKITDSELADPGSLEDAIIEDEWGRTHASGVHVGGRIVLNVWRLMRGELKLSLYTIEAVVDAVLRRKVPNIPYKVLTRWFSSGPRRARHRCIEYIKQRGKLNLELMNQLDMINRTSELARVFGIDFFSVLSRGSQYRVESMYLRLAHTQNYLAISPGNRQVASQPAMECIPLVMEPESGFYADPVIVLDFQSLYPSMIIAYNLCYSTCLGNVAPSKENILGVCGYSPDPRVLEELREQILVTPNGVMYAPSKVRKGVLPRLLEEILSTRIMVKQSMKKLSPSQQVLYRIFNARQLALKLIANVTYGYTAAGFSGRMPCAELADSIVQCGRRTLETAISFVNSQEKWKARVIYGDTDSLFVLLKGRSVEEAFRIGSEIASEISAMNPNPVVLKMEKVYHPCFLLTKKRYVGYSYESPKQAEPVFDAKGIETVRRDTCKAVSKTMEKSLRLFFERQNISEVKVYLQRQWQRILSGRFSLQDFVFAKEVRLGSYSSKDTSSLPPAAIVATKAMRSDPRAEPRYGDRIPYIVIHGNPGARLVDMVVDPSELLAIGSPYRLNDLYYITKQIIPALQRVFGLVGADLNKWFSEMPRQAREAIGKRPLFAGNHPQRTRIDSYYLSRHCVLCGELVEASAYLCSECSGNKTGAVTALVARTSKLEREMQHLAAICRHCGGGDWLVESGVKCTSLACQVFYERCKLQKELQGVASVAADQDLYPKCMVEWF